VYRLEIPHIGRLAGQITGLIAGRITEIYFSQGYNQNLHKVVWDATINMYTGCVEEYRGGHSGYFDYGLHTAFELKILVRGGLLDKRYPDGCFDEPQPESLVKNSLPYYRKALMLPYAPYILPHEV
jgi:hypothetical protein